MAVATAHKKPTAKAPGPKDNVEAIRQGYYDRIAAYDLAPLWEVMKNLVVTEPKSVAAPTVWHYKDVRPLIAEAEWRCAGAISPGMMSCSPANSVLVARDLPRKAGFSSTSTRRSASLAVISSPASAINGRTSL